MKQEEDATEDTENDLHQEISAENFHDGLPKKVQKRRGRKSRKSSPPPPPPPPKQKAPAPPHIIAAPPSSTDSPERQIQPNGFANGVHRSASNTPRILRKLSDSSQNSSMLITRLREANADRDVAGLRQRQQLQSVFDSDITNLLNGDSSRDLLTPIDEKKRKRNTEVLGADCYV